MRLTDENLKQAEYHHYKFQVGMYFSDSKQIEGATFVWNDKISDAFWNYATKINITEDKLEELIKKIRQFFSQKNRKPAIYFTPFTIPKNLPELISNDRFKLEYTESWMFYEQDNVDINLPAGLNIKKVETEDEMKILVDTFNKAYSNPDDPYGVIPKEYGECLFDSYKRTFKDKKIIHFLGFLEGVPVGIASVIISGNYAGIYGVGTIPQKRTKGIGTAMTMQCALEAKNNNANVIFLQTETGSFNEKFYTQLGFNTKFIGRGFVW